MRYGRHRRTAVSAALGFGLAASLGLGAAPATAVESGGSADRAPASPAPSAQGYVGEDERGNQEIFKAVVREVIKQQRAEPGIQQVTVTYDASSAPTFQSEIANSTSVWNSAVENVQLQEGGSATFDYREGNDPRGSYAQTDGRGNGFIFLDYAQNEEYDSNRVTAHETGHVLGLPDNYSGPCEELMSGGGPGPSCTNDQPNAAERQQIEQLWANGVASVLQDDVVGTYFR